MRNETTTTEGVPLIYIRSLSSGEGSFVSEVFSTDTDNNSNNVYTKSLNRYPSLEQNEIKHSNGFGASAPAEDDLYTKKKKETKCVFCYNLIESYIETITIPTCGHKMHAFCGCYWNVLCSESMNRINMETEVSTKSYYKSDEDYTRNCRNRAFICLECRKNNSESILFDKNKREGRKSYATDMEKYTQTKGWKSRYPLVSELLNVYNVNENMSTNAKDKEGDNNNKNNEEVSIDKGIMIRTMRRIGDITQSVPFANGVRNAYSKYQDKFTNNINSNQDRPNWRNLAKMSYDIEYFINLGMGVEVLYKDLCVNSFSEMVDFGLTWSLLLRIKDLYNISHIHNVRWKEIKKEFCVNIESIMDPAFTEEKMCMLGMDINDVCILARTKYEFMSLLMSKKIDFKILMEVMGMDLPILEYYDLSRKDVEILEWVGKGFDVWIQFGGPVYLNLFKRYFKSTNEEARANSSDKNKPCVLCGHNPSVSTPKEERKDANDTTKQHTMGQQIIPQSTIVHQQQIPTTYVHSEQNKKPMYIYRNPERRMYSTVSYNK
jgi:hypothetical protein